MKKNSTIAENRKIFSLIGGILGVSLLVVSLLINVVLFMNKGELNAGQIKRIAYGKSLQYCLEDPSLTKADCANTKLADFDEPKLTYGGEAWAVGSYCFDMNGIEVDCTTYESVE